MTTQITIIRHGETHWNLEQKYQGQLDSDLTGKGIRQVKKTAQLLKNKPFDVFYSSDLGRAVESAEILNHDLNLDITLCPELRERNFGVIQGMSKETIAQQYPELYRQLNFHNVNFSVDDGETFQAFYERVIKSMVHIEKQNRGQRILIMAHGGILNCLFRYINDIPLEAPRRFSIPNGGINAFTVNEDTWMIETWGLDPAYI